jgi:hypothetical protein
MVAETNIVLVTAGAGLRLTLRRVPVTVAFFRRHLVVVHAGVAALSFHFREDSADVVAEADVEHAVDLVEDDEADVLEVDDPPLEQVHHAARRADEDLRPVLEELHLRGDFLAAVDGDDADRGVLGEAFELGVDLDAELARGHEDDRLRRQPLVARWRIGMPNAAVLPVPVRPGRGCRRRRGAGDQQRLDFGRG